MVPRKCLSCHLELVVPLKPNASILALFEKEIGSVIFESMFIQNQIIMALIILN